MIKYLNILSVSAVFFICSCGAIKDTPKYSFSNGYYKSKVFDDKTSRVYIDNTEDSVFVHQVIMQNGIRQINAKKIAFPQQKSTDAYPIHNFRQASFDIDFLTIPFKFRPQSETLPQQFNTNLNGVIYFGYRNDFFRIKYKKTPLNIYHRNSTHYGLSYGFFTGFGGTAMNPWVTKNNISSEYDGVVWSKGVSAIIGIDNFSIGLALGFDYLTDANKKHWIYQDKPWFGLAFGLNLN